MSQSKQAKEKAMKAMDTEEPVLVKPLQHIHVKIFEHTITLKVKDETIVAAVRRYLHSSYGCVPEKFELQHKGKDLHDELRFSDYSMKDGATVKVLFEDLEESVDESSSSSSENLERDQDDDASGCSSQSSASREEAKFSTLKKAMTCGGMHVRELSPSKVRRQIARITAKDRAVQKEKDRQRRMRREKMKQARDITSILSEVAQRLMPKMLDNCAPILSKQHSFGGA
jgi:hypothetical protein